MLAYSMLGTNDLGKAKTFYDAVLGEMGYARTMDFGVSQAYGANDNPQAPQFAIGTPHDKKAATVGNGVMVAFYGVSIDKIKAAHAKALALGGKDEGAPMPLGDHYAGYVRDLDGNKLCFSKF